MSKGYAWLTTDDFYPGWEIVGEAPIRKYNDDCSDVLLSAECKIPGQRCDTLRVPGGRYVPDYEKKQLVFVSDADWAIELAELSSGGGK